MADGVDLNGHGSPWRWTIDLTTGTVREEQVDDRQAEFPRIDDRLAGLRIRRVPAGFHGNWLPDQD
ncbi:hypothetical protein [Streptacidiphilus sp. PB12-B1b]|uniref:hypothetical protein n=1 Tax=Streptacidiphilus sp. PB12-B1b TaxID=2705012 RepID=UPI00351A6669